ncbi:MAG: ferritin family protein [Promethearchaeota archaeon]
MDKNKLKSFLKDQITLEEQIVATATASVKTTENRLVRRLIEGIAIDSNKHALILQAIIAHLESKTPFITEEKRNELGKNIRHHIELEAQAIKTYSNLIPKSPDSGTKKLLEYILEDERRHHKLLKEIYTLIIEKETLTEQDLWDLTWKDVPFHGSPGG